MDMKEIMESNLSEELKRDLYSRKIATGEVYGPLSGKASIDKPWLKYFDEELIVKTFPNETMYEHILNRNKNNLDLYALNYFGKRFTYREMFEKLNHSGIFDKGSKIEVKREKVKQEEKVKEDSKEKQEELWELDDEDFDSILEKLEESIYELNSKHMMEITEELKVCSYQGKALKEIMVMAQRKIEMSDYISAVDMMANWKEKNRR